MQLLSKMPARAGIVLFVLAALYFAARGPLRGVGSVNSYDFASLYGATRCWLHAENPYEMRAVNRELHAAGDDPQKLPNTDPPPSVYLPTALPLVAPIAWLPWKAARIAWMLLSVGVFACSCWFILRSCGIGRRGQWLLGAGMLLFSPTSSGLSTGNPSVVSCGLTLLAMFLLFERERHGGGRAMSAAVIVLGIAHCIKPQISIAAVAVLLLWGCWRAVALSAVLPVIAAIASFARVAQIGIYSAWISTLRQQIRDISASGAMNDASPANYFSYHLVNTDAILRVWMHNGKLSSALVWLGAAGLTAWYMWWRRKRTATAFRGLQDVAFFCALCLTLVYHRYYDAQLLLGVVPFLLTPAARRARAMTVIAAAILLALVFPLQAILAESWRNLDPGTPAGFLLLRHQPVAVVILSILLAIWPKRTENANGGQELSPNATVSVSRRSPSNRSS